jgi:hypothetical protein
LWAKYSIKNSKNKLNEKDMDTVKFSQIEEKILTIRGQKVILDSDVATLYEVETMRVNEAVKNNPDKFP